MNAVTLAKYALALLGVALVLLAERVGRNWVGYAGLVMLVVAFMLRFMGKRVPRRGPPPP